MSLAQIVHSLFCQYALRLLDQRRKVRGIVDLSFADRNAAVSNRLQSVTKRPLADRSVLRVADRGIPVSAKKLLRVARLLPSSRAATHARQS